MAKGKGENMRENMVPPALYLVTGLLILPLFFFNESLVSLTLMTLSVIILNLFTGRRIRILPSLIVSSGIILTNLLQPGGKLLFSISGFPVTEESLFSGLQKALFLSGMIYVSRFSVRKGLRIPGKTGAVLIKAFYYFEKMTEISFKGEGKPGLKKIVASIDIKLMELDSEETADNLTEAADSGYSIFSLLFCSSVICFFAFLYFLPDFNLF